MPIIFFVAHGYGGFGDFQFAIKNSAALKRRLAIEKGYTEEVLVITSDEGKYEIQKAHFDEEFGVNVLTEQEFKILKDRKNLTIDHYLEGPVPLQSQIVALGINKDTPATIMSEYSLGGDTAHNTKEIWAEQGYINVAVIETGLRDKGARDQEKGLIISPTLVAAQDDLSLKLKLQSHISPILTNELLKESLNFSTYYENHELTLEYSYSHERFLKIHASYIEGSKKNHDIICIGSTENTNTPSVQHVLQQLMPTLISNGFNKIVYIGIDDNNNVSENILYHDTNKPEKTYRIIRKLAIDHESFLGILANSSTIVGITGDQSLGEAISLGKMFIYECRKHKIDFNDGLYIKLNEITEGQLEELITLLSKAKSTDDECIKIGFLLRHDNVAQAYKFFCDQIIKYFQLSDVVIHEVISRSKIIDYTSYLQNAEVSESKFEIDQLLLFNKFKLAIYLDDDKLALKIILDGLKLNIIDTYGTSPLLFALQLKKYNLVEEIVKHYVVQDTSSIDFLLLTFKNDFGKSLQMQLSNSFFSKDCPQTAELFNQILSRNLLSTVISIGADSKIGLFSPSRFFGSTSSLDTLLIYFTQLIQLPIPSNEITSKTIYGLLILTLDSLSKKMFMSDNEKKISDLIKTTLISLRVNPANKETKEECYIALQQYGNSGAIQNNHFKELFYKYSKLKISTSVDQYKQKK